MKRNIFTYKFGLSIFLTTFELVLNAQPSFQELASEYGIEHYHRGLYGGGVAIFDFNNDGFEDIYLTGGLFRDKLYKNNGNKTFTDVTLYSGFARTSQFNTSSVSVGDINNDGFKDLFIGTYRNQHNLLYLNNGDNTFSEISNEAGLERHEWAVGGAWADFDLDGYLDLYVINYVQSESLITNEDGQVTGFDHDCFPNQLFLNNGDLTFTEIRSSVINNFGCGLAVAATDLNNDFIPDIYVANDFGQWIKSNAVLKNNGTDTLFQDISSESGMDAKIFGMGIAVGDYDRDGLKDYYVSNIGSNVLYHNQGNGSFLDVADAAGVSNTKFGEKFATSWGTAFFDYDHDGFEDLFVSNGFVRAAAFISTSIPDPNQLYRNLGNGTFQDVAPELGLDNANISRGMAVGDLDNDGDLDIVVSKVGDRDSVGNTLIFENQLRSDHHWLEVKLRGTQSNYDGYGANVKVYFDGTIWVHEIDGGSSHASHNSALAHFGLGDVSILDSIKVIWPGGGAQIFFNVPTDQSILIQQDESDYFVMGCMDPSFDNYDPDATYSFGCYRDVPGCLDQISPHFNIDANIPLEECGAEPLSLSSEFVTEIYPNPSDDRITIKIPGNVKVEGYHLLSISGSVINSGSIAGDTFSLEKGRLDPGVYVLQLFVQNKISLSRKIIFR